MKAFLGGGCTALAPLCLLGVAGVSLGASAAPAGRACDERIRVLIYQSRAPVVIERSGRHRRFELWQGGIRVDGGPAVPTWRAEERGLSRVRGRWLRGALEVLRTEQGLAVVNEVGLEDYVVGALEGEIPASWSAEALRAQAVASRTYALHRSGARRAARYDVEASTASQVYAGAGRGRPELLAAARDTRCEILTTAAGRPILAAFHSASGGRSASAREVWGRDLSYLVSQAVEHEEDSPDTYWRAALSRTTLGRALAAAGHSIGQVEGAEILEHSASRRVARLLVEGTGGEVTLSGRQLRAALGESTLKSTLFELRPTQEGFLFVGSGSGHGVGMSQWGARGLAERGMGYREILETFYPGARLKRLPPARVADVPAEAG